MPRPLQLAATLALTLLPTACSSAGSAGAGPATPRMAAERQVMLASEAAPSLPAPVPAPPSLFPEGERPRQRVAAPLTMLNQMVTTQALLVSLLLAPVSTKTASAAPTGTPPKASASARSN